MVSLKDWDRAKIGHLGGMVPGYERDLGPINGLVSSDEGSMGADVGRMMETMLADGHRHQYFHLQKPVFVPIEQVAAAAEVSPVPQYHGEVAYRRHETIVAMHRALSWYCGLGCE